MGTFANSPDFVTSAKEITPSDTLDNSTKLKDAGLFVGNGGTLCVIMTGAAPESSNAVTFRNIPDGSFLPIIVDYVLSTGTTCSGILAFH
jgi:hypothetical protein